MASVKPITPKGTRDFGPEQSAKRAYIIDAIKANFKKYGFQELATPAMENLSTLTGKYGDEGDQLLFKVLNSGDYLSKAPDEKKTSSRELLPHIAEKGLRYDLTVPFARYVVANQHEIAFPFKRFQIQPVWRADRPQKGRYREFYQCDADIIGSKSIWNEAELSLLVHDVFSDLGLNDFVLKVNHRGVLFSIAEYCGMKGNETAFCVELDKLDKIGREKVTENLVANDAHETKVQKFLDFALKPADADERIERLTADFNINNEDLTKYFELVSGSGKDLKIELDLSLARGLTYYTGMIFEVKPTSVEMGSISGGGRYDDLTGVFGLKDVSGVGISFGLDRIYDVLAELELFPDELTESVEVLILHFDEHSFHHGLGLLQSLREDGVKSDIYPESVKIKKQFNYADKVRAGFALVIGEEEMQSGKYKLKDLKSGDQLEISREDLLARFRK